MPGEQVWIVDAFTDRAFAGNSAGIVLDAEGLSDAQMQAIAREINSAETTFIERTSEPDADVSFRWFAPGREVEFCGHATLAGVHAVRESGRLAGGKSTLRIATRHRGVVAVRVEQSGAIWFDVPRPTIRPCALSATLIAELIGADAAVIDKELRPVLTSDNDVIIGIRDQQSLASLVPRIAALREQSITNNLRGVFATTRRPADRTVVAHSRFFAPAFGVDEDPVTGSAHGPLATYLVEAGVVPLADGRAAFQCSQGQPGGRGGIVRVEVEQTRAGNRRVTVGGTCATALRGGLAELPKIE